MGLTEVERGETAVGLWELLLDDVRLDRHAKMVGLARQICGHVIVGLLGLERGVPEITPQDREHAQFMSMLKHLGHFLQLPLGLLRPKVDGRADPHRAHLEPLFDAREADLIERVGIRDELVVVELHQKRDLVRVLPSNRA